MGFVERVACKALHLIKDRDRDLAADSAAQAALNDNISVVIGKTVDEHLALALHNVVLLFAHSPADDVSASEAVTREGS